MKPWYDNELLAPLHRFLVFLAIAAIGVALWGFLWLVTTYWWAFWAVLGPLVIIFAVPVVLVLVGGVVWLLWKSIHAI